MPIRVMLVDDSAVVRGLITRALEQDPMLSIVATAANGRMAVDMAGKHHPDIIVLDIEMPEMDGITALPLLLEKSPNTKIIMASTLTLRNAGISMQALQLGAADYLAKPSARGTEELEIFYHELREKVRVLGGIARQARGGEPKSAPMPASATMLAPVPQASVQLKPETNSRAQALAIASSTGGPQALLNLFGDLKGTLSHIPIFITQHMPPTFTTILAEQIGNAGSRPCHEAKHGDIVQPGHAYLAPGDFHMTVIREQGRTVIQLDQNPPVNFCRPAADPMFESLAKIYGVGLMAAVLTGMGFDGAEGAKAVSRAGGAVIAQDAASCVVYGMPKATAEAGVCQAVLPLSGMAKYIIGRT